VTENQRYIVLATVSDSFFSLSLTPHTHINSYLSGSKRYRAGGEFGFETTTLDMEGNVTKTAPYDHISPQDLKNILEHFRGTIQQIPPIFSAIRQGGKKLYQKARAGATVDDVVIEPRQVEVYQIEMLDHQALPKFDLDVECGGGTYIRSIIRDIGRKLNSVATTTYLERTQHGQFTLDDCIEKDEWNADNIYAAVERQNTLQEDDRNEE
jgi:tRNA pseudouridine55 synthase